MGGSSDRPAKPGRAGRKFLTGTRGLLAFVVLVALGSGWLAFEKRRADRQTALIGELRRVGTHAMLNEPTTLGQIVRKYWPRREPRIRDRIGSGWFDRPTIFLADPIDDDQAAAAVERLQELGTVKEVHYGGPRLTEAGIASLSAGLPGVNVVPNANPALHYYFLATMGTHVAYGLLGFMIAVALTALGLLTFAVRWLARRSRRTKPASRWTTEPLAG